MTTSTPPSTSKSSPGHACRCDQNCGCCTRKALAATVPSGKTEPAAPAPQPGFFASRPWLWVYVAFAIMFSAWTVMFAVAIKNKPQSVELTTPPPAAAH